MVAKRTAFGIAVLIVKQRQIVKPSSPKSEKIQAQTPQLLKGTATLDQLPEHPETTRSTA
jgi:hypothetical protein